MADGVLVDVTATARDAGFVYPVALTGGLWSDVQDIPSQCPGQDVSGRMWDVLWLARQAIKRNPGCTELFYPLTLPVGSDTDYTVKLVCGPGDHGEPVITLMRPEED